MAKNIGLDLGYSNVKMVTDTMEALFPSITGNCRQLVTQDIPKEAEILNMRDVNRDRFVGDLAIRQSPTKIFSLKEEKSEHGHLDSLIDAALASCEVEGRVNIMSGLPMTFYFNQKDSMAEKLRGVRQIKIERGNSTYAKTVLVDKTKMTPEPMAAAMNVLLNNKGMLVESLKGIAKGTIGVVDIGFHTVDYLLLDGLEVMRNESRSTRSGIHLALKALEDAGIDLPIYQLDKAVRNGEYRATADLAFRSLSEQIVGEIQTYWNKVDLLVLAGGGGSALSKFLSSMIEFGYNKPTSFDIARGLHKMAQRLWKS